MSRSILLALALLGSLGLRVGFAAPVRPNVVLVIADDLNDWIGALGGHPQARTPRIDAFAARGVNFLNAHCQAPLCGPSRASLLSGRLPGSTGIYGMIADEDLKPAVGASHPLLPEVFSQAGYETYAVGKILHEGAPSGLFHHFGGRHPGFGPAPAERLHWKNKQTNSDWGPYPEYDGQMPDVGSVQWAEQVLSERHARPFFLAVGLLRPHVPWHVPQRWFDLQPPLQEIQVPRVQPGDLDDVPPAGRVLAEYPMMPTLDWMTAEDQWRQAARAYLACITFVDAMFGRILDALAASPYADNTVVVFVSDNGYHVGEKGRFTKMSLWERSTRVPFMLAGPGVPGNRRSNLPVGLIDIYPTLLALTGIEAPGGLEGANLVDHLRDPQALAGRAILTTFGRGNHSLRDERYRYTRYSEGGVELYDHLTDPDEWFNLAGRPEVAAVAADLASRLPARNHPWVPASSYEMSPALTAQRARDLAPPRRP